MENQRIVNLARPIIARFKELEAMMSSLSFHENSSYASYAKEHSDLLEKINKINEWENVIKEIGHAVEMSHSEEQELQELARSEKEELQKKCSHLENEILQMLLPRDPNEDKNIVIEIRAGTGGEEAALFASELGRMYLKFSEEHGFRCETISLSLSDRSGFKEAIFFIEGKSKIKKVGPFSLFKYERGVHRVQRVPETEAGGRIHTSTVTVAVLPEAEEVDVQVRPEDLRIDTYRASGAGGQHVNKTDSAVRITHIPTNTVVACQVERSQIKNRATAMKLLRAKLYQVAEENKTKQIASDRKQQIGTGERSEKIRTYNFPQDRITDHRIGFSVHHIMEVLEGHLDPVVEALQLAESKEREGNAGEK